MPVSYRILPSLDLVVVTYRGIAGLAETMDQAEACSRHPDFRPSMRTLVDLTLVTGHERDFPEFFRMQARLMETYSRGLGEQLFVYLAPTPIAQSMAQMVVRQWEGLGHMILRLVEEEDQALALLGIAAGRIGDLTGEPG